MKNREFLTEREQMIFAFGTQFNNGVVYKTIHQCHKDMLKQILRRYPKRKGKK